MQAHSDGLQVLLVALLSTKRESLQITGMESRDVREGRDLPSQATQTRASEEDAETPEMQELFQGPRVTNVTVNFSTKSPNSPHRTQTPFRLH